MEEAQIRRIKLIREDNLLQIKTSPSKKQKDS